MRSLLLRRRRRSEARVARVVPGRWLMLALLLMPLLALAQAASDPTPLQYRDAAEEARFHALAAELRCVQCQNQSLADSNAQIAHDLRREVLELMQQGRSDAEIKQFLVDRYGEFVLYRPALDARNSLLWFGPLGVVLVGAGVLVWVVRRRSRTVQPIADSEERW
jgi:cytochrome c-type biogenesis protein CcmH